MLLLYRAALLYYHANHAYRCPRPRQLQQVQSACMKKSCLVAPEIAIATRHPRPSLEHCRSFYVNLFSDRSVYLILSVDSS